MKNLFIAVNLAVSALAVALPVHAVPNLALGADASASDGGWGGGNTKSDLTDGKASYYDTWMHGLAAPWYASGDFHVVLNFGSDLTFNSVTAWWHAAPTDVANVVTIQTWNNTTSSWSTIYSTNNALALLGPYDDPNTWTSSPTTFLFGEVTSGELRMIYDNSEIYHRSGLHGWLHEVAVNQVPEPGMGILFSLGLAGLGVLLKRTSS